MGEFEFIISNFQLDEIQRVLNYPKFKFTEEQKTKFLGIIYEASTLIEVSNSLRIIKEDINDNIILESADKGNADYIISGDEHLLKLNKYKNIKIVTPVEFLIF